MDMRNNRRRNVLTHARVNFSQSETSSLLRGGGELKFELLLWGGVNRKDPDLARNACIRQYLQESYKNGVILQVQKSLASFLKESCKETPDLLNRHFLQKNEQIRSFLQEINYLSTHYVLIIYAFHQKASIIEVFANKLATSTWL